MMGLKYIQMSKINFSEKTVIVTGASSGIGLALAQEFAKLGANVVLAARSEDKLAQIIKEIEGAGGVAMGICCDVTNFEQCQSMVFRCVERFGGVDILINNAGLSMRALFDDVEIDVLRKLMDVNFWGAVNCTKCALPYIQQNKGSIVGISSIAGLHGLPARTGYSASKYALQGFLDTLRVENLYRGVHVMVAIPGFTESNVRLSALTADGSAQGESPRNEGKMMTAQQVANLVIRGVWKKKREVLMDFEGWGTKILKFFMPKRVDKIFFNVMSKEPNSPLRK